MYFWDVNVQEVIRLVATETVESQLETKSDLLAVFFWGFLAYMVMGAISSGSIFSVQDAMGKKSGRVGIPKVKWAKFFVLFMIFNFVLSFYLFANFLAPMYWENGTIIGPLISYVLSFFLAYQLGGKIRKLKDDSIKKDVVRICLSLSPLRFAVGVWLAIQFMQIQTLPIERPEREPQHEALNL